MRVGACRISLRISESQSLKQKRKVVKSVIDRVKNRFNIAIAEVDALDSHKTAVLGVVTVSNDSRHVNRTLSHVVDFIEDTASAEMIEYEIELN
ncbi:MAG: DUF503 domain-containing protein [Candidatus Poribacteria bacterium]|nr:DUF503 domain-containing protein [Candidatus Poribacteria bacterium]